MTQRPIQKTVIIEDDVSYKLPRGERIDTTQRNKIATDALGDSDFTKAFFPSITYAYTVYA